MPLGETNRRIVTVGAAAIAALAWSYVVGATSAGGDVVAVVDDDVDDVAGCAAVVVTVTVVDCVTVRGVPAPPHAVRVRRSVSVALEPIRVMGGV